MAQIFSAPGSTPSSSSAGYCKEQEDVTTASSEMSKHYQFESMLSMTGANADERFTHKPIRNRCRCCWHSTMPSTQVTVHPGLATQNLKQESKKQRQTLKQQVVPHLLCAEAIIPNIQIVVNAINEAIGANGKTIDWSVTIQTKQGIDSEFARLLQIWKQEE